MSATRVVVVGAGISGLSAAFRLRERFAAAGRPLTLTVLESQERAGGHARTHATDGFLVEEGPNGFLDRAHEPHARALARDLGLESALLEARPEAKRRFLLDGGRLRRAPDSPPALLTSDALTPAGKLRMMLEPFVPRRPAGRDETVFEFAKRRIGREAAERLVDTAVSGISAGDSRELSVADAFPLMTEMEREHGSLVRALIARRKLPPARLMAFRGGMGELVAALRDTLGAALVLDSRVTALESRDGAWRVRVAHGATLEADVVVLATHAWQAAPLLGPLDSTLAGELAGFPRAGLALVAMAFRAADVRRALDGYGYLVRHREGLETLGVVWESSLFAGRAPAGQVLLRVMLGGVRHPRVAGLSAPDLLALARRELGPVLGVTAAPVRSWVRAFPDAIAQYTLGHTARVERARDRLRRFPGLELTGTSYDGASFNHAIRSGGTLAGRVFERAARERPARPQGVTP